MSNYPEHCPAVTGALDELDKFVARPIHSGGELRSAWATIQQALSRESDSRIPHDKRDRVGPFFTFTMGPPLSREQLVTQVCQVLLATGEDPILYSGHNRSRVNSHRKGH